MNTTVPVTASPGNPRLGAALRRRFVQVGAVFVLQAVILFGAAGHLDWWPAWVYLALSVSVTATVALVVLPRNPDLIAERGRAGENAKRWDYVIGIAASAFGSLGVLLVAALDERFGWSPPLSRTLEGAALVVTIAGYALFVAAKAANRFFSSIVRIQKERGHTVVDSGPYGTIRHPGYAGVLAYVPATAVFLGSLWALVPAALGVVFLVVRTVLEDRTLQAELSGYGAYAARVRYRLLPGVW